MSDLTFHLGMYPGLSEPRWSLACPPPGANQQVADGESGSSCWEADGSNQQNMLGLSLCSRQSSHQKLNRPPPNLTGLVLIEICFLSLSFSGGVGECPDSVVQVVSALVADSRPPKKPLSLIVGLSNGSSPAPPHTHTQGLCLPTCGQATQDPFISSAAC